ncbi:MAG: hypothetical protein V5A72_02240 [Candidatus Nanohaloarchaea archaeon]
MREIEVSATENFQENSTVGLEELRNIIVESDKRSRAIYTLDRPLKVEFDWADNSFVLIRCMAFTA